MKSLADLSRIRGIRRQEPALASPRFLSNWRVWTLLLLLLLIPFFVPISPGLRRHPVIGILGDQLHTILLGAMTFLLYWRGPLTGRLTLVAVTAAIFGGSIEFIQILVGRAALFHDFVLDLVGIGLATGYILWRGHKSRLGMSLMVVLLIYIPVQLRNLPHLIDARRTCRAQFPLLVDFEAPNDLQLWRGNYEAEIAVTAHTSLQGTLTQQSLRISTEASDRWPGAVMGHFPPDWSVYDFLSLDIRLIEADSDTYTCYVRVDDFKGRQDHVWLCDGFRINSQWQTCTVPLTERLVDQKTRYLDLTDMQTVTVFVSKPERHIVIEVDNVRLH